MLSDMGIPFTVDQVRRVFRDYNNAVWPAQWLLVAMAFSVPTPRRRHFFLASSQTSASLRPPPWASVCCLPPDAVTRRRHQHQTQAVRHDNAVMAENVKLLIAPVGP
jgi:hypothetical protein